MSTPALLPRHDLPLLKRVEHGESRDPCEISCVTGNEGEGMSQCGGRNEGVTKGHSSQLPELHGPV